MKKISILLLSISFSSCAMDENPFITRMLYQQDSETFYPISQLSCSSIPRVSFNEVNTTWIISESFMNCHYLQGVDFSENSYIQAIGLRAFYGCENLTVIKMPSTLNLIEKDAFAYNKSLQEVTLPAGLKAIRDNAFAYCEKLKNITIEAITPFSLSTENPFRACPLENIYVPAQSVIVYKNHPSWRNFAHLIKARP